VIGKIAASDIIDPTTKEVVFSLTRDYRDDLDKLRKENKQFDILFNTNLKTSSSSPQDDAGIDKKHPQRGEALSRIYRKLNRAIHPPTSLLRRCAHMFFHRPKRYAFQGRN